MIIPKNENFSLEIEQFLKILHKILSLWEIEHIFIGWLHCHLYHGHIEYLKSASFVT